MNANKMITTAMFTLCLLALAASAIAQSKQPVPAPSTPKDLTYKPLRAVQYCEVWLFVPQSDKSVFVDKPDTFKPSLISIKG
jgi:hypothetical protein